MTAHANFRNIKSFGFFNRITQEITKFIIVEFVNLNNDCWNIFLFQKNFDISFPVH